MKYNQADTIALNDAFVKLFKVGGLNAALFKTFASDVINRLSAEQTLNYYVDAVNGNDFGDGSVLIPFKTINRALDEVRQVSLETPVNILVRAGTYAETLNLAYTFNGPNALLHIQGTDYVDFTPATGSGTGVFDASFGTQTYPNTAVVTGATWTVDNLQGKFVLITAGANLNQMFPIANNTATTLDIGCSANASATGANLQGQSFRIVSNAAILAPPTNPVIRHQSSSTNRPSNTFTVNNIGSGVKVSNFEFQ